MVCTECSAGVDQPSRLGLLRTDNQAALLGFVRRTHARVLLVEHRQYGRLVCHLLEFRRSLTRSLRSVTRSRCPGICVLLCCTVGIILEITATYSTPRYLHENLVVLRDRGIDVLNANILFAVVTSGLHDDRMVEMLHRNVQTKPDRPMWLEVVDQISHR